MWTGSIDAASRVSEGDCGGVDLGSGGPLEGARDELDYLRYVAETGKVAAGVCMYELEDAEGSEDGRTQPPIRKSNAWARNWEQA